MPFVRRLPDGYETLVGDGGRTLSAGERRRIALARALLRGRAALILDEPTADLDPESADLVAEALERLRGRCTILVIAHRLELARATRTASSCSRPAARSRAGGGMTPTLRRLLALAGASRRRTALAVGLGALTVLLGVGLMSSCRLPDLARRRASGGALADDGDRRRALLRARRGRLCATSSASARTTSRSATLARVRARTYERLEPLAPGGSRATGRATCSPGSSATSTRCRTCISAGSGRRSSPLRRGRRLRRRRGWRSCRSPGVVLAAGLLVAGRRRAGSRRSASGGVRAGARLRCAASSPAELVELLQGGPRARRLRAGRGPARARRRAGCASSSGSAAGMRSPTAPAMRSGSPSLGLTVAGVLAVAVSAHAAGRLDSVLIATLGLLALASFEAVEPLAQAARELGETIAAGRRVLEVCDRESPVVDPDDPAPLPGGAVEVALEASLGALRAGRAARCSTTSASGSRRGPRIALVGPSGAGKTTVANLLLRFLDPEAGRVTLGGRDLREYRQEDVRRRSPSQARTPTSSRRASARTSESGGPGRATRSWSSPWGGQASADWVATLPDGLDTLVGEEGRELSGGQRQRLSIARALLADAPLLVLDEPTAHLDPLMAQRLVEDVFAAAGGRSVLLITHRPEGLELVDEIHELGIGAKLSGS